MTTGMIRTPHGVFSGAAVTGEYPGGAPQGLRLEERNAVLTGAGELVPSYGETVRRKRKPSVTFHPNGQIKSVALEAQTAVNTPIGQLPAELVLFYDTGELSRVFPLDGQLSGFWSEDDERTLATPLSFDFGFTSFSALISGIGFYRSGRVRSVTLFPKEVVRLDAERLGKISVRNGFSLYESGEPASLEPAEPTAVLTPIGVVTAYDVNADGICADTNSLRLDKAGRITRLVTSESRIRAVSRSGGRVQVFKPTTPGPDDDRDNLQAAQVEVSFEDDAGTVRISDRDGSAVFSLHDDFVVDELPDVTTGCASECHNCKGCAYGTAR